MASASDWPEFRGPTGQGHAPDATPPLTWSPTVNVRWVQPVVGSGWSSPIVYDNQVFATAAVLDGSDQPRSLRMMAWDLADGTPLWNRELFAPRDRARKHSKNSHASPTPIALEGRLYAHFGPLGTACLNLDGQVLWRQQGLDYPPVHGAGGSPVLVGDRLIFSCDGQSDPFFVALDKETGRVEWRTPRPTDARKKFSFSTPLAIESPDRQGSTLVVSPGSGVVGAYDAASGGLQWWVDYGEGYSVIPKPVSGLGMVFVGTGYDRPEVMAIRLGGRGDITESHVVWQERRGAPHTPSMLLVGEFLYYVSDGGIASCVQARTGRRVWQERLGGDVSASPVSAGGRIYVTNEAGKTFVLQPGPAFRLLAQNDLEERTLASMAVSGSALIMRTASRLYRIEED